MTFAGPIAEHGFATEYEQLRRGVLDGEAPTRHFGLVILMREGVAAWMAHASARPATHPIVYGLLGLVGLFMPGLLAMAAVLPFWSSLRTNSSIRAALKGVNAIANASTALVSGMFMGRV